MKKILLLALALVAVACENNNEIKAPAESDAKYVGQAVGNFSAEEWYPGGELGTTTNVSEGCYQDPAPAVTAQGLDAEFNHGEMFFERNVTLNGVGPQILPGLPSGLRPRKAPVRV